MNMSYNTSTPFSKNKNGRFDMLYAIYIVAKSSKEKQHPFNECMYTCYSVCFQIVGITDRCTHATSKQN